MKINFNFLILFIYIIFIFYIFYNFYKNTNFEKFEDLKKVDLVISRYNEDLSFLLNDEFKKYIDEFNIIIYNKGPEIQNNELKDKFIIIQLPNVGRECHTNLYHIINNYENLADVTIFLPGSFYNLKNKKPRSMKTLDLVLEKKHGIFLVEKSDKPIREQFADVVMDVYESSSKENKKIMNKSQHEIKKSPERPFKNWFIKNFPDNDIDIYSYNCIFAVDKKDIIKNDIQVYQNLIKYLNDHTNPEVGHYMERSWGALFKPNENNIIYHKQI